MVSTVKRKSNKISITKNKETAEVIIATHLIFSNAEEANSILNGIKDTLAKSDFTSTANFANFMNIYSNILRSKRTLVDNFCQERSENILREIKESFRIIEPSDKKQKMFEDWLSSVEKKLVYSDIAFMTEDGEMDISEIIYFYYWNCYKDLVDTYDVRDISYYEKLSIPTPKIIDGADDLDIITLNEVTSSITTESKYTFGIDSLDDYIKLQPTNLFYVGARPSVGKSMLVMNAAIKNALRGIDTLYVSLEMTPAQTKTRVNNWIKGERAYREVDEEMINKHVFFLDAKEMSGDYVFSKIERFALKHEGCVVILDYVGLIRYSNLDEWGSLREASRSCKRIALKTGCVFLSPALATRESEMSGFTISSLYGASTLEADADGIIGLEPVKGSGREIEKLDIKIAKNRDGIKDVDCWVDMNKETMHFEDAS